MCLKCKPNKQQQIAFVIRPRVYGGTKKAGKVSIIVKGKIKAAAALLFSIVFRRFYRQPQKQLNAIATATILSHNVTNY